MSIETEYVYANKGWNPASGDVCEAYFGKEDVWFDAEVVPLPSHCNPDPRGDYVIKVPARHSEKYMGLWSIEDFNLRRRLPPEQKDSAEDSAGDFEEMMTRIRFEATKAHIKVLQEEIES